MRTTIWTWRWLAMVVLVMFGCGSDATELRVSPHEVVALSTGGAVLATSDGVVMLDAQGRTRWHRIVRGAPVRNALAVTDDVVILQYVSQDLAQQRAAAFAHDGIPRWDVRLSDFAQLRANDRPAGARDYRPIVVGNRLVTMVHTGTTWGLVAIDVRNGSLLWRAPADPMKERVVVGSRLIEHEIGMDATWRDLATGESTPVFPAGGSGCFDGKTFLAEIDRLRALAVTPNPDERKVLPQLPLTGSISVRECGRYGAGHVVLVDYFRTGNEGTSMVLVLDSAGQLLRSLTIEARGVRNGAMAGPLPRFVPFLIDGRVAMIDLEEARIAWRQPQHLPRNAGYIVHRDANWYLSDGMTSIALFDGTNGRLVRSIRVESPAELIDIRAQNWTRDGVWLVSRATRPVSAIQAITLDDRLEPRHQRGEWTMVDDTDRIRASLGLR